MERPVLDCDTEPDRRPVPQDWDARQGPEVVIPPEFIGVPPNPHPNRVRLPYGYDSTPSESPVVSEIDETDPAPAAPQEPESGTVVN